MCSRRSIPGICKGTSVILAQPGNWNSKETSKRSPQTPIVSLFTPTVCAMPICFSVLTISSQWGHKDPWTQGSLLVTGASLVVTSALLVVTRSY